MWFDLSAHHIYTESMVEAMLKYDSDSTFQCSDPFTAIMADSKDAFAVKEHLFTESRAPSAEGEHRREGKCQMEEQHHSISRIT